MPPRPTWFQSTPPASAGGDTKAAAHFSAAATVSIHSPRISGGRLDREARAAYAVRLVSIHSPRISGGRLASWRLANANRHGFQSTPPASAGGDTDDREVISVGYRVSIHSPRISGGRLGKGGRRYRMPSDGFNPLPPHQRGETSIYRFCRHFLRIVSIHSPRISGGRRVAVSTLRRWRKIVSIHSPRISGGRLVVGWSFLLTLRRGFNPLPPHQRGETPSAKPGKTACPSRVSIHSPRISGGRPRFQSGAVSV